MVQLRPWLPNFTQHSDQVCGIKLGSYLLEHTGRAGRLAVKWGPHSMENALLGKVFPSLDDCKLCQVMDSGSLQAICIANILYTDSRAHDNLLKCPRAHGSYIADNLVTENI